MRMKRQVDVGQANSNNNRGEEEEDECTGNLKKWNLFSWARGNNNNNKGGRAAE